MGTENKRRGTRDLDVRIKLLMIVEAGMLSFFTGSNQLIFIAFLSSLIVLLWFGQTQTAIKFSAVFSVVFAAGILILFWEVHVLGMVLGMLSFLILRLIPVLMLGSWLVKTTEINDFIASMEKMNISNNIIIPLAVTLRFMPTIQTEFRYIKNTMKMRGIALTAGSIIKQPLVTTEYAMVPLLMRSIKVADELSASALTRGIGRGIRRTSYRDVCLNRTDVLWAVGFSLFVIAILFFKRLGLSFFV